jgi:hypothetical protein
MAVLSVKSFLIDNVNTTDAEISAGIDTTSTVFSVSVVPISNQKSRVVVIYN